MVNGFIFKICQGKGRALKLHVIDLREQQPMLLHFISQEIFRTQSSSVGKACKERTSHCIVLDWIAY